MVAWQLFLCFSEDDLSLGLLEPAQGSVFRFIISFLLTQPLIFKSLLSLQVNYEQNLSSHSSIPYFITLSLVFSILLLFQPGLRSHSKPSVPSAACNYRLLIVSPPREAWTLPSYSHLYGPSLLGIVFAMNFQVAEMILLPLHELDDSQVPECSNDSVWCPKHYIFCLSSLLPNLCSIFL